MSKILRRQNLLWEGSRMFLPEHREYLLQQQKTHQRFTLPELCEDRLEEINHLIQSAWENDTPILLYYVENHQAKEICGFIEKIHLDEHLLQVANGRSKKTIRFSQIFGAERP